MSYREFAPLPALTPYVECFWTGRTDAASVRRREILIPDGTTQLLLSFGGPYHRFADPDNGCGVRVANSHIIGFRTRGIFIEQESAEDVFAIRFRPGGLYPFLPVPMTELVQQSIDLDAAVGRLAGELEARVYEASSPEEQVRAAEGWLCQRLSPSGCVAEQIGRAVELIYTSRGRASVERLAAEVAMSHRSLDRAFALRVGVSPKRLGRIVRFNFALALMHQRQGDTLSAVAHAAGYVDQSHMSREFREFTHTAPRDFLARDYRIVQTIQPTLRKRLSSSFKTSSPPRG